MAQRLNRRDVQQILDQVKFKDWRFELSGNRGREGFLLQLWFSDAAGDTWSGRKWRISQFSTRSEIVQTALKAVLTAVEHEAREAFTYKGRPIFCPHFNVDALVKLCDDAADSASMDYRPPEVSRA